MAKTMGKMQTRRMLQAIESKAKKLWMLGAIPLDTKDLVAIERITKRYINKLK